MNESILSALMQMFAIVATVNTGEMSDDARTIVESYLKLQLSQELVEKYLKLFDEYFAVQSGSVKKNSEKQRKRNSMNSVKVLKICNEINETLQQRDKVIVVIRLLEFVKNTVTDKELDFINTVAETFNILEQEYTDLKTFVLYSEEQIADKSQFMIIGSQEIPTELASAKFLFEKNIKGVIEIIRMKSTNLLFFKYKGDDALYMNSSQVIPNRTYLLGNGTVIKNPKITPIYFSDISSRFILDEQKARLEFCADNIEFKYSNTENGIHKFSFYEESGNLIGIMGGSGVGKSTLLNLLIGNYPLAGGKITINGYDYASGKEKLKGVIGYVPQDDLLIEELTVFENLYFNAKLCFSEFSEHHIIQTVMRILMEMDLNEIRDLKVGGPLNKFISGGQRKRLNIALELMREPSVLIADEPTSGLSSADSEMVMTLLKEQTFKGKLVIVNIHQPSSDIFKMFDKILVMDRGGYPAYYGNPLDAIAYFKNISNNISAQDGECPLCGNVNPEQILETLEAKMVNEYGKLTRNRKISPKEWYELFNENIAPKIEQKKKSFPQTETEIPENNFKVPSKFNQFKIFFRRNVLSKIVDKQYMLINLLESPVLAAILAFFIKFYSGTPDEPESYVFANNENIPAYIFMCVICSMFIGLTVSAEDIIRDRMILSRERFLNLSWSSYINSKTATLFIISAIQTLSFVLIGNLILEIHGLTLQYWLVLFSTSCFANLLGLNISSALTSVVNIYILIPFIIVPQLLFAGVLVGFNKMHKSVASADKVPIIGDIMTSRWAYEALVITQFEDNEYNKHFYLVERQISQANYDATFLIPNLKTRIELTQKAFKTGENMDKTDKDILVIRNMVATLKASDGSTFARVNDITKDKFNDTLVYELNEFLDKLKSEAEQIQAACQEKKDAIYASLVKEYGSRAEVLKLQRENQNKRLDEMLLNKNEVDKIFETKDGKLIQQKDPAYHITHFRNGRAHFYSPIKKLGGLEINTYTFNVIFIWLTTTLCYFALKFLLLKKLLNQMSKFQFKLKLKSEKKH
ncbi:MAG: ATP-binding cassette domain-containing protein [Bacteroidales bacterium]|jgi:ABC-type multidrug transport system ATPase subunit|nr:ATP-binding cassette domain-containing protein [Bacteroidales bacterium]MBR6279622.1 ATP-binding cassette domain-containing protein [Bacteroidales bacterium]